MGTLAQTVIDLINPDARIITDEQRLRPSKSEVERLLGSNQKIKQHTPWKPQYTLPQGLAATIDWFRDADNLNRYKADIYHV